MFYTFIKIKSTDNSIRTLWRHNFPSSNDNTPERENTLNFPSQITHPFTGYVFDRSKWRKVNARYHGITRSKIPDAPWTVLKLLRVGARILRGIRIAGRLGLSISKDTETAICILQSSVKSLNKDKDGTELHAVLWSCRVYYPFAPEIPTA
uniref:Uncharacterized protein n=1 Tax=Salix viminalis TaxID=40686 RepID=A0A6N2M4E3_SALVM